MALKMNKEEVGEAAKRLESALDVNIDISASQSASDSVYAHDIQETVVERIEMPPIILQKPAPKPRKVQLITSVPEETRDKLKYIAKQQGVSLNAFLGAVYNAIIAKYNA